MPTHLLLLIGPPGVGKTTIIRKITSSLGTLRAAGFYTEEIRSAGDRVGFRAVTLDGREHVMAHVAFRGAPRVGKYGVDVAAIDALAETALTAQGGADVYVVDEIGKMECLSQRFVAAMRSLLDSRQPVIAAVGQRGGGFIGEVKRRRDAELWNVTPTNRDELPARALEWLAGRARI